MRKNLNSCSLVWEFEEGKCRAFIHKYWNKKGQIMFSLSIWVDIGNISKLVVDRSFTFNCSAHDFAYGFIEGYNRGFKEGMNQK